MNPIISEKDLFLDNERKIIPHGKIDVYDPISNTYLNVYTYDAQNDAYIPASNPIILNNESRPNATYFVDQMAYCQLYKYLGEFMDPMTLQQSTNWEFIRSWYSSANKSDLKNDTVVTGIIDLRDTNPELGNVTVVGYWNDHDCEARTYVWDENSVQADDGGYIIKNNDIDTGRWILQFDGEYLPSTYYGVYPGKENNINALLNYVSAIGSRNTAPGIYFIPGSYTDSSVGLVTSKNLLLDANTYFTRENITCKNLKVIGSPSTPICDFYFTDSTCVAHSSWFKTAQRYLQCNSKHFIIDNNTSFSNSQITSTITLTDAIWEGSTRLPVTYATGQCLSFQRCTIIGEGIFSVSNDYVKFANMTITDKWWTNSNVSNWSIGTIANGNHIEAKTAAMNNLYKCNFNSANVYFKFKVGNGNTDIDMEDATISAFDASVGASSVLTLRNCRISGNMTLYHTMTLYNVRVDGNVDTTSVPNEGITVTADNCRLYFYNDLHPVSLTASRSKIYTHSTFTSNNLQFNLTDCDDVSIALNYATNNTATTRVQTFKNCYMRNCTFGLKEAHFYNCYIDGGTYKFYPYKSGSDYYLKTSFVGCTVNMSNAIEYTKFYGGTDGDACYGIWSNNKWVGNNFCGSNTNGITMPLWAVTTSELLYLRATNHPNHICEGNVGNCPAEKAAGYWFASWSNGTIYGRSDHPSVKKMNLSRRAFPNLKDGYNGTFFNKFVKYACPIDPTTGYTFTHWGIFDTGSVGDFFAIGLYATSYNGNIKIA